MFSGAPTNINVCLGGHAEVACGSTVSGNASWVQCEVGTPSQVLSVTVLSETSASLGCSEKNSPIPETRNEGAVPAWHYDTETGVITVAGGCDATFDVCYGT